MLDSVTNIGGHAFEKCSGLNSLHLTNSSVSVGEYAFAESSIEDANFGIVRDLGDYVFYNCASLTDVSIENSVDVSDHAFDGCTSLTSFYASEVPGVGNYAFAGCENLPIDFL